MDVLIPEINNSSSTTADNNPTTTNLTATLFDDVFSNCTPLSRVDLVDVFAKMDVGSTEFWGSASVVWMTFFIMYCILFYAALFGVFCYWAYVYYRIKHLFSSIARFPLSRLLCLQNLQIFWFASSFVHGILVINSVASGRDSEVVAVATRTIETVTSLSFVSIIIATPYFSLCLSLTRIILSNLVIYFLTMAIIVISIVGGSGTLIVVMIVLRSLLFIASVAVIFVILLIFYFKNKFYIYIMMRQDRRLSIYILITFLYFLISYLYFLYTLSTVASNSNCIEKVQLHRAVWLVLNFLLRICEVSFFMLEARALITKFSSMAMSNSNTNSTRCTQLPLDYDTSKVSKSECNSRETKESTTYHIPTKSVTPVEEDIFDARDSEKKQIQQTEQVQNIPQIIEFEQLYHTLNVTATLDKRNCEVHTQNVEYTPSSQSMSCQSAIPNQLKDVSPSIDPDHVSQTASCAGPMMNLENVVIEIESLHQNHNPDNTSAIDVHNVDLLSDSVVTCSMSADITHYVKSISYSDTSLSIATESPIINEGNLYIHVSDS